MQAVQSWSKGKEGERGSGAPREGPTLSSWAVGPLGRESWGRHSLTQGWVLSVSLKGTAGQTAALPHLLSLCLARSVQWDNLSQRVGGASVQQHE